MTLLKIRLEQLIELTHYAMAAAVAADGVQALIRAEESAYDEPTEESDGQGQPSTVLSLETLRVVANAYANSARDITRELARLAEDCK